MLDDRDLRQMMPLAYVAAPYRPPKSKVVAKLRSKARRLAREKLKGEAGEEEEEHNEKKSVKSKRRRDGKEEDGAKIKRRKFDKQERGGGGKNKAGGKDKKDNKDLSSDRLASYTMHKKSEVSGRGHGIASMSLSAGKR